MPDTQVAVIGGGVVGVAVLYTLAHRGVDAVLLEADTGLAYGASGTNSGILHTGFDSTPGELETALILRAAALRDLVLDTLSIPILRCGAELTPRTDAERATVAGLLANARANNVEAELREDDGALLVPGESVTDPVAYTKALAEASTRAGAVIRTGSRVEAIEQTPSGLTLTLQHGERLTCQVAINCAGLHADAVARMVGDDSFEIYPRKGEFFVFETATPLNKIILPAPTKRTKGVLVFPTLDGRVVAGPTAVDELDKTDWTVRPGAEREILDQAVVHFPALEGLEPVAAYAGLRPAGRGSNYVIGPSARCERLVNVAAIRSTGLTASLGIGAYVADLLPALNIPLSAARPPTPPASTSNLAQPWYLRTARHVRDN